MIGRTKRMPSQWKDIPFSVTFDLISEPLATDSGRENHNWTMIDVIRTGFSSREENMERDTHL
jgi:hypothetical protein